ncbi:hypothetical protein [Nostoc sp.]|uniref:hypothetical protein n=1 Tax=Nostoc sp. TaxID=1180 RepID=UPI002FF80463
MIAKQANVIAKQANAIAEQANAIAEQANAVAEQANAVAEQANAIARFLAPFPLTFPLSPVQTQQYKDCQTIGSYRIVNIVNLYYMKKYYLIIKN